MSCYYVPFLVSVNLSRYFGSLYLLIKERKKTFLNTEWLFALSRFDLLNSPCEEVTNFFAESKTIMLLGFLCTVESCIVSGRGWSQTSCGVSRAPSIPVTLPVTLPVYRLRCPLQTSRLVQVVLVFVYTIHCRLKLLSQNAIRNQGSNRKSRFSNFIN